MSADRKTARLLAALRGEPLSADVTRVDVINAARVVISLQRAMHSDLQRELRCDWVKADKLIDELHEIGIISDPCPGTGSKVLVLYSPTDLPAQAWSDLTCIPLSPAESDRQQLEVTVAEQILQVCARHGVKLLSIRQELRPDLDMADLSAVGRIRIELGER